MRPYSRSPSATGREVAFGARRVGSSVRREKEAIGPAACRTLARDRDDDGAVLGDARRYTRSVSISERAVTTGAARARASHALERGVWIAQSSQG